MSRTTMSRTERMSPRPQTGVEWQRFQSNEPFGTRLSDLLGGSEVAEQVRDPNLKRLISLRALSGFTGGDPRFLDEARRLVSQIEADQALFLLERALEDGRGRDIASAPHTERMIPLLVSKIDSKRLAEWCVASGRNLLGSQYSSKAVVSGAHVLLECWRQLQSGSHAQDYPQFCCELVERVALFASKDGFQFEELRTVAKTLRTALTLLLEVSGPQSEEMKRLASLADKILLQDLEYTLVAHSPLSTLSYRTSYDSEYNYEYDSWGEYASSRRVSPRIRCSLVTKLLDDREAAGRISWSDSLSSQSERGGSRARCSHGQSKWHAWAQKRITKAHIFLTIASFASAHLAEGSRKAVLEALTQEIESRDFVARSAAVPALGQFLLAEPIAVQATHYWKLRELMPDMFTARPWSQIKANAVQSDILKAAKGEAVVTSELAAMLRDSDRSVRRQAFKVFTQALLRSPADVRLEELRAARLLESCPIELLSHGYGESRREYKKGSAGQILKLYRDLRLVSGDRELCLTLFARACETEFVIDQPRGRALLGMRPLVAGLEALLEEADRAAPETQRAMQATVALCCLDYLRGRAQPAKTEQDDRIAAIALRLFDALEKPVQLAALCELTKLRFDVSELLAGDMELAADGASSIRKLWKLSRFGQCYMDAEAFDSQLMAAMQAYLKSQKETQRHGHDDDDDRDGFAAGDANTFLTEYSKANAPMSLTEPLCDADCELLAAALVGSNGESQTALPLEEIVGGGMQLIQARLLGRITPLLARYLNCNSKPTASGFQETLRSEFARVKGRAIQFPHRFVMWSSRDRSAADFDLARLAFFARCIEGSAVRSELNDLQKAIDVVRGPGFRRASL